MHSNPQTTSWIETVRQGVELLGPWAIALGIVGVFHTYDFQPARHENWAQVLASTIDSSAIAAGFLATGAGLLYALRSSTSDFAKTLKEDGTLKKLIAFVWRTFFGSLVLVGLSWSLLVRADGQTDWLVKAWAATAGWVAASVVMSGFLVMKALENE